MCTIQQNRIQKDYLDAIEKRLWNKGLLHKEYGRKPLSNGFSQEKQDRPSGDATPNRNVPVPGNDKIKLQPNSKTFRPYRPFDCDV